MQPFQRLIHNSGLLDLPAVSSLSIVSCPFFKISGIQVFEVQVRLWNHLSIMEVIHKYTKNALSMACIGG